MIKRCVLLLLMLCMTPAMAEKIYKWVDENGQIHYSSQKPVGQDAQTVTVKKAPKVAPAKNNEENEDSADANAAAEEAAEDDPEADAAARAALAKADAVNNKKQCELARKNLAALSATVRVTKRDANGELVRLTDDQRLAAMKKAQAAIKQYCQ